MKNNQVFLKTATNTAKVTPADRTYNWVYGGDPTSRLLSGEYDQKQKGFTANLAASTFQHGNLGQVTFTADATVPGEFTFTAGGQTYSVFVYDITQTSFAINNVCTALTTDSFLPNLLALINSDKDMLLTTLVARLAQASQNQTVDIVLAFLLLLGSVIGVQFGSRFSNLMKGEHLRFFLSIIILLVGFKLFSDLITIPKDIFSIIVLK